MPKKHIVLCILIFIITISCYNENNEPPPTKDRDDFTDELDFILSLKSHATIYKNVYFNSISNNHDEEYIVKIEFWSVDKTFLLDTVQGAFFKNGGPILRLPQKNLVNEFFVVEKGKTETFVFSTNGYTDDLLSSKKEEPLNFAITISLNKKGMYSSFIKNLPNLNDLPLDDGLDYSDYKELIWTKHKQ